MEAVEFTVDNALFDIDTAMRAAHRYSGEHYVEIESADGRIVIRLMPKDGCKPEGDLKQRFENDLLDELVRDRIRRETQEIHIALVRAALREASPDR